MSKIKINKTSVETRLAIERRSAAMLPDRPTLEGLKPWDIKRALFEAIISGKGASLMGELDRIVDEFNEVIDLLSIKSGSLTVSASSWTGEEMPRAAVRVQGISLSGFVMFLSPADDETKRQAERSRVSVEIDKTSNGGWYADVVLTCDERPSSSLNFRYHVLPTESEEDAIAALVGVDAYGSTEGVDEEAVKALISEEVPEWARAQQKPEYTAEEVKARPDTWTPTAAEIGARPSTWMPTADEVGARPNTWTPTAGEVGADPAETAAGKVKDHNEDEGSHVDIRLDVTTLRTMLQTVIGTDTGKSMRAVAALVVAEIVGDASDSFDTLEEIAAWIEAHPNDVAAMVKRITDLETAMGGKVSKTDIINTLDSTALDKPLSAAMGAKLNAMLSEMSDELDSKATPVQVAKAISDALAGYALKDHNHDGVYAKPSDIPTVPQTLPNPYSLSLLGKTYNGASAVSLTVEEIMEAIKTASGGVLAWIGADNNIYLSGTLSAGNYKAYYEVQNPDGTKSLVEIGDLILGDEAPETKTYTITWANYDGTVLETDAVTEGEIPAYDGATPTKPADDQYTYTFREWNPTVVAATANATYTAVYNQTAIAVETYTVTFVADGATVATVTYEKGATSVTAPAVPEKTGYTGAWESYSLNNTNITVNAVYTAIEVEPAGPKNFAKPHTTNKTDWSIWCNDARFGSDGGYRALTGNVVTNYIDMEVGDIIRFTGLNVSTTDDSMNQGMAFYKGDQTKLSATYLLWYMDQGYLNVTVKDGVYEVDTANLVNHETANASQYFRISGSLTGTVDDVVINVKHNGAWL